MADWARHAFGWLSANLAGGTIRGDKIDIEVARTRLQVQVGAARGTKTTGVPQEVRIDVRATLDESGSSAKGAYRGEGRPSLPFRPRLALRPRTDSDAMGRSLGLSRELPTGDARFDTSMWIESDAPSQQVLAVLETPGVRDHAAKLVALGASAIRLNDGDDSLAVEVWLHPRERQAADRLREALATVAALAEALPSFSGKPARLSIVSVVMEYAFLPLPLFGFVSAMSTYQWRAPLDVAPILKMLGTGLALWVFSVPIAFAFARGRHNGFLLFKSTAIPLLIGLPTFAVSSTIFANGAFDQQRERHVVEVVAKTTKDSDYLVRMRDYRAGAAGTIEIKVGKELWDRTKAGDRVVLTVSPGRLGWPWVVGVTSDDGK